MVQLPSDYLAPLQSIQALYSRQIRINHVAYCLLRGTPYNEIEPTVHIQNQFTEKDWNIISEIQDQYTVRPVEQTLQVKTTFPTLSVNPSTLFQELVAMVNVITTPMRARD